MENNPQSSSNELNKENQFQFHSLKRNHSNRHSLNRKLEYKHSVNRCTKPTQLTTMLSNSISCLPVVKQRWNQNEKFLTKQDLIATSSDGAMSKMEKDFNLIKRADNRLPLTTKNSFLINTTHLNDNEASSKFHRNSTALTKNSENKSSSNANTTAATNNKRRASMVDSSSMHGSGVSPTKMYMASISQIQEFVETSIVLKKDKNNELGISIIGGSDTYLESICVKEVHEKSAAYVDGRIRKGDLILGCNEYSFRTVSYADAIRVLREAVSPLKLLILRENPQKLFTTSQSPTKFITVELKKQSIKDKLGISLLQRTNGVGVFVTYVIPNSIAAIMGKGKILQGDQLLEINGQNVRESNQKDIANQLNQMDGELVLLLGRVPSLTSCIQDWCRKRLQIHWRMRTSTWSAYGGSKDKIQNQRPSLPVGKETPVFNTHSPEMESRPQSPFSSNRPSISNVQLPSIGQSSSMMDTSLITTSAAAATVVASSYGLDYGKGNLIQQNLINQVSQQLRALQEQEQQLSKQIYTYPDKYCQNCVNTPEDAISLFSRSSSVRSRNRLSVLIEDPSYNKQIKTDLETGRENFLSRSPSLYSANLSKMSHLFTEPVEHYSGPEIEPLDDSELTCYLAEKLDAEDKFVPFEDRDKKDQQELYEMQLQQQRLAFQEERQAAQQDKHKSKLKQIIAPINDSSQTNRHHHHKRSFLLRRSNSSKTTTKTKKTHIPSIQVTEF